jgi:hypothetical protein
LARSNRHGDIPRYPVTLTAMRILILAIGVLCLSALGAIQKQKKPADVTILEANAKRGDGKILVDGRVRVTAQKQMHGLVIVFDLLSAENGVMASEKAVVEEDWIAPGQDRSYHAETFDPVRAVRYRIRAFDHGERELSAENTGPFPIE